MEQNRESLAKVLGRGDVLALAFGAMIGWGWVMLAGHWVSSAGTLGAIIAFIVGAILCVFVGLAYAELTPALPLAGGELVFSYRGLGYFWSWVCGWAICFAYVGVAAWEGIAISTAIDYLFELPKAGFLYTVAGYDVYFSWSIIGIIGAIILTVLNYMGAKPAAIFQTMATIALVIIGAAFVFGGVAFGDGKNALPLFTSGTGMAAVLLMAPSMYVGFDVIPQAAEEMNIPAKAISKVLLMSILMGAAWYILMIVGISLSAPASVRDTASIPVADSMAYAYGSAIWGKVLIVGGLCGILTSWNGFFIGASRVMFAMGRAKMLPGFFGKVHPKYNSPYVAVIFTGIICCISPFLGKNALVWFVDAAAFGTVIAYFLVSCSFIRLRKIEPELNRPYKVAGFKFVATGAIIAGLFFIYLYTPLGPSPLVWPYEWGMVGIWTIIGIVLAMWANRSFGAISPQEREYLVFGPEYARKNIPA